MKCLWVLPLLTMATRDSRFFYYPACFSSSNIPIMVAPIDPVQEETGRGSTPNFKIKFQSVYSITLVLKLCLD